MRSTGWWCQCRRWTLLSRQDETAIHSKRKNRFRVDTSRMIARSIPTTLRCRHPTPLLKSSGWELILPDRLGNLVRLAKERRLMQIRLHGFAVESSEQNTGAQDLTVAVQLFSDCWCCRLDDDWVIRTGYRFAMDSSLSNLRGTVECLLMRLFSWVSSQFDDKRSSLECSGGDVMMARCCETMLKLIVKLIKKIIFQFVSMRHTLRLWDTSLSWPNLTLWWCLLRCCDGCEFFGASLNGILTNLEN